MLLYIYLFIVQDMRFYFLDKQILRVLKKEVIFYRMVHVDHTNNKWGKIICRTKCVFLWQKVDCHVLKKYCWLSIKKGCCPCDDRLSSGPHTRFRCIDPRGIHVMPSAHHKSCLSFYAKLLHSYDIFVCVTYIRKVFFFLKIY